MRRAVVFVLVTPVLLVSVARPVLAQGPDGAALFARDCASCHAQPTDANIPTREAIGRLTPEAVVEALANGSMRLQGALLNVPERRAIAEFVTGRAMAAAPVDPQAGLCAAAARAVPMTDPAAGPSWNGWGNGVRNARVQSREQGGLTAADVPRLTLKWAFGFPDAANARSQPTVAGGRLFVGNDNGTLYALNAKTGCTYWTFRAQAGVRSAVSVGPYRSAAGADGYAVFFGDTKANAYAVDASTGQPIWVRKVDDHPGAGVTGSPTLHAGRLYVAAAGLAEEGQGGRPQYECCTFRGSLSALDANTGAVVWKTYTIPQEARPRAKNAQGVQTWGPAGAGVWAAPTVDVKRNAIYVSTGNGYADPPVETTDAVLAFDMTTGRMRWSNQITPNDVWGMGCKPENPDNPNCPQKQGPDHDFSASPLLTSLPNGRDLIVIPQKSGMAYALDPDKQGAIVWQYRAGEGSGLGGVWGAAADGQQAYISVGDLLAKQPGGIRAVRLDTGQEVWSMPPQKRLCGEARGCNAAQGAAVTVIPGIVLSGSVDGGMRGYSTENGALLWQFDTNREFETVNRVKANGGSMDGPGAVAVDGMLYFNSGYGGLVGRPGNVLLAFGVD